MSTPIFQNLPYQLEDYTILRLMETRAHTDIYQAQQGHVGRIVILGVLHPAAESNMLQGFIETARLRAKAQIPHVTHVLEARCAHNVWFMAQEQPAGESLLEWLASGRHLTPLQAAHVLLAAAEMYESCTEAGKQAQPLSWGDIFISESREVQFLSPIIPGLPSEESRVQHMQQLAQCLIPVRPLEGDGCDKISAMLQWLQEGYEGQILEWHNISATAQLVIQELNALEPTVMSEEEVEVEKSRQKRQSRQTRRIILRKVLVGIGAVSVILGLGSLGIIIANHRQELVSPVSSDFILCKTQRGIVKAMRHPVSIEDYNRFLKEWDTMTPERRSALNEGMPGHITHHKPEGWNEIFVAASLRKEHEGIPLSPESPAIRVSYWNALAYARYQNAKLPNMALLQAVHAELNEPGISEWVTDTHQSDPLNIYPKESPMILDKTTITRPLPVSNGEWNSSNLGFRLIFPQ